MIDASAILAVLLSEVDGDRLASEILSQPKRLTTPVALTEASLRLLRLRAATEQEAIGDIERFLEIFEVEVKEQGAESWRAAIAAYARYGRGRHPARLNFGDCLAYAAAKQHGSRLVFKGDDFPLTNVNDPTETPPR